MVIRELIAKLGFDVDKGSLSAANTSITGVKNGLNGVGDKGLEAGRKASQGMDMFGRASNIAKGLVIGLGVAVVSVIDNMISGIREASDEMQSLDGRLRIVTKSEQQRINLERELYQTAQNARQDLGATGDLYFKISKSAKELGVNEKQALEMTETVTKALTVGGATTQQTTATILQLGQALSSGRLQGDELRSLDENAFDLMQAVAEYFGTTIGNLKQMGSQGELTSDKVAKAILYAKKKIDSQFDKMPITIGQAFQMMENSFKMGVAEFERSTGLFSTIAHGIVNAVKGIETGLSTLSKIVGGTRNLIILLSAAFGGLMASMVIINFSKIISAFRALAVATSLATWEWVLIAAAITILILAIQDLYTWINGGDSLIGRWLGSWEDFKAKAATFLKPLIDGFNELVAFFSGDSGTKLLKPITDAFSNLISVGGNVLNNLKSMWEDLKPTVMSFGDVLLNLFTAAQPIINVIIGLIAVTLVEAFKIVIDTVTLVIGIIGGLITVGGYVVEALISHFNRFLAVVTDIINIVVDLFTENWDKAISDVKQYFSDLESFVLGILTGVGTYVGNTLTELIYSFLNTIISTINAIVDSFMTTWDNGISNIKQFFSDLVNFITNILNGIITAGIYVVEVLISSFNNFLNAITNIIDTAVNSFISGWDRAISDVKQFFSDLESYVLGILSNIGIAIGTYVLDKLASAKNAVLDFLGWSSSTTNKAISDNRRNYNQNINVQQTFNGGTAAENRGYMQQGAQRTFGDFGLGMQYNY